MENTVLPIQRCDLRNVFWKIPVLGLQSLTKWSDDFVRMEKDIQWFAKDLDLDLTEGIFN